MILYGDVHVADIAQALADLDLRSDVSGIGRGKPAGGRQVFFVSGQCLCMIRRGKAEAIFDYVDPTPPSCPALRLRGGQAPAGHPVCTASAVEILSPRRRGTARPVVTGSSAFADDDIMWCANVIEKR